MPLRNAGYALVSLLRELAKDFQPLILRNPDFRFGFRIEAQDRLTGAVVTDERHLVAGLPLPGQDDVRWHTGHIESGERREQKRRVHKSAHDWLRGVACWRSDSRGEGGGQAHACI